MISTRTLAGLAVTSLVLGANSLSQAALSFTGSPIVQNFDSYVGTTGRQTWANDSTIPGTYLYLSGGSNTTSSGVITAQGAVAGTPDIFYRGSTTSTVGAGTTTYPNITVGANAGSSGATFAHYLYMPSSAPTDGKLGLFNSDNNSSGVGTGYVAAGIAVTNNSGVDQTGFYLNYLPTTFSTSTTTNIDSVAVSYAFDATGVADADGVWTTVAGMGYSTSISTSPASPVLIGPTVNEVNGITWAAGSTLFIRFKDTNVGGVDRLTQVDNIVVIPEPASLAVLGLGATGLLIRRRIAR